MNPQNLKVSFYVNVINNFIREYEQQINYLKMRFLKMCCEGVNSCSEPHVFVHL